MALKHPYVLHSPSSALSPTLISYMSNASHTEPTTRVEENTTPLPVPPRTTTSDAPESSIHTSEQDTAIQERFAGLLQICEDGSTNVAGIHFPHPDEPTPSDSMTPTKKIHPQPCQSFHVLIPPFKHHHRLAELDTPSHSLTTSPPTKPSLLPSPEYITTSTVATCTSSKLKRSFESVTPSSTKDHQARMKKLRRSSRNSTRSDDWNLDLSHLPLRHQHPLTSPSRHRPY